MRQVVIVLRSIIQHLRQTCSLSSRKMELTTIYKDNISCISQLKEWYIKSDRIKYILLKFFFHSCSSKNW